MNRLIRHLRAFGRDEGGSIIAEAVIVLPLFLWAYLALYVYWDAFRALNLAQKASYTISDYISRERGTFTTAEINGLDTTFEFMLDTDQDVRMRFTSLFWNPERNRFEVNWSRSPNAAMTPLTTASLQGVANRIPAMSDGDTAILVETAVDYSPAFDVGMGDQIFENFIITRPRFLTKICLEANVC